METTRGAGVPGFEYHAGAVMSPEATLRFRQTTAALAAGWAFLSLIFSIWGNVLAPPVTDTPVQLNSGTGAPVVTTVSPQAREAGVVPGDLLVGVDERSSWEWIIARAWSEQRLGEPNRYVFERRDGSRYERDLPALPPQPIGVGYSLVRRAFR